MLNCDTVLANTPNIEKVSRVVVSLSGGLDSTVLLHLMVRKFGASNVFAISFDYQQRHDVELQLAKKTCKLLGVEHTIVDISFLGKMAAEVSAMVKGDVATPTIHDVLGDPQPATYMPNRNMILASISAAFAETKGCDGIALGIQATDSYSYWDTTPDFYNAIEEVLALNRKNQIYFVPAFLNLSKADEITLGVEMDVDFGNSWTCYNPQITPIKGHEREPAGGWNTAITMKHYQPCGICPSCAERAAAFKKVGLVDPVVAHGVLC